MTSAVSLPIFRRFGNFVNKMMIPSDVIMVGGVKVCIFRNYLDYYQVQNQTSGTCLKNLGWGGGGGGSFYPFPLHLWLLISLVE